MTEPTAAEVDHILERFDLTERSLQRKIVAWLMFNLAELEAEQTRLVSLCDGLKMIINAQESAIADLEEDLAELEADKRRLDWIIAKLSVGWYWPIRSRASIDDAMKAQSGEGGGDGSQGQ